MWVGVRRVRVRVRVCVLLIRAAVDAGVLIRSLDAYRSLALVSYAMLQGQTMLFCPYSILFSSSFF